MNTSGNSQTNKSNLKLFGIIVAAIIVALVTFTGGKNAWDSYQAGVARDQAVAAQHTKDAAIAKQQAIASLQQLHAKIGPPGTPTIDDKRQYSCDSDSTTIKECLVAYEGWSNWCPDKTNCDYAASGILLAKKLLRERITDYNAQADKIDPAIILANGLPTKPDENGDPSDLNLDDSRPLETACDACNNQCAEQGKDGFTCLGQCATICAPAS